MKKPSFQAALWTSVVALWVTGCAEDATFTAPNGSDSRGASSADANAAGAGADTTVSAAGGANSSTDGNGSQDGVDTTGIHRPGATQTGDAAGNPNGSGAAGNGTSGGAGSDTVTIGNGKTQATTKTQSFKASQTTHGALEVDPDQGYLTASLKLTNTYDDKQSTFAQTDRPMIVRTFQQGNPGAPKTDHFAQANQGVLDIQLVVDDSGSMAEEQANLATKLDPLLDAIKDADWQININTTDPAEGCSRALLKKGEANLSTRFNAAVTAGIAGSGNERGVLQAVNGLGCTTTPWLRAASTVAVLVISDEDNCSYNGGDCGTAAYASAGYLKTYLTTTLNRKLGTDARFYGIYWDPNSTCSTAANKAAQYASLVADTNGAWGSICDTDYSATLARISQDVSTILKAQYQLSAVPDAGSVTIKVNGQEVPHANYTITKDVVTFAAAAVPPRGATIDASYIVGSRPMTASFPIGEVLVPGMIDVMVNGVASAATDWTFHADTMALEFAVMPAVDATIKVTGRKNVALLTSFDLAATAISSSLAVTVNGAAATGVRLDGTHLLFDTAPADAAAIVATYKVLHGPTKTYAAAFVGEFRALVSATFRDSEDVITGIVVTNGMVDFTNASPAPTSADAGREVAVVYKNADSGRNSLTLPDGASSVTAGVDGDANCTLGHNITLTTQDGHQVLQALCPQYLGKLKIAFNITKLVTTFTLDGVAHPESGTWTVTVDGQATTAFSRTGATVAIASAALSLGSTVVIAHTDNAM